MIQVVLDIETLGLPKQGVIPEVLAIGAMVFDDKNKEYLKYFYRILLPNRGYADKSTKEWWLKQSASVKRATGVPLRLDETLSFDLPREVLTEKYDISFEKVEARSALRDLRNFCITNKVTNFWANSPTFDCRILEELALSLDDASCLPPWYNEQGKNEFWRQRDIRTIKDVCDQFRLIKNSYAILKIALDDFKEMDIGKMWNAKHFALYDCVSEGSLVYATQHFLNECQTVIES